MRLAAESSESSDDTAASIADSTETDSSTSGHLSELTVSENDSGLAEERFRVDRRKLEQMLQAAAAPEANEETADEFFQRVMEETGTQISWPSKLKVGAKSKKDPHIKITGLPEAVMSAREKILENLDTKRHRVTLKMDVSFTDHSHIIGKGGHNIQQVMEETGCHIHFPDSNRNSVGEKSNQVSIAGQPFGVEKAKCRIRELLPMVITFELPMSNFIQSIPDVSSPALALIQNTYCFTLSIRPKLRGGPLVVTVRGCRRQLNQIRQGIHVLMGYLTGNQSATLPVTMTLEVAPQHHAFVLGRANCNVQNIMRDTGANICFPDPAMLVAGPPYNNQQRKSTVTISGHFDCVYLAWQEIMRFLPLVLLFDLKEGQEMDTALVTNLMDHYNLNIVVRPKPKQNTKSIMVRGFEKDSALLFEVRRQFLNLDRSEPCEYEKRPSDLLSGTLNNAGQDPVDRPRTGILREFAAFNRVNPTIPPNLPVMNPMPSGPFIANPHIQNTLLPWIMSQMAANPADFYGALLQAHIGQLSNIQQPQDMNLMAILNKAIKDMSRGPSPTHETTSCTTSSSGHASSFSSAASSPCDSPIFMSSDNYAQSSAYGGSLSSLVSSDKDSQQSVLSSWNSNSWLGDNPEFNDLSTPSPYDEMPPVNPAQSRPATNPITRSAALQNAKPIGSERWNRSASAIDKESDYMQKRLMASRVMNEPVNNNERVPTDVWSGCGFSKSMPQQVLQARLQASGVSAQRNDVLPEIESGACAMTSNQDQKNWSSSFELPDKDNFCGTSNYLESLMPRPALGLNSNIKDLNHLFTILSLEKYLDVFRQQQVDLSSFLTLTDHDLQELSIPYSARRRMLLAINELQRAQDERTMRAFHAAPGAERRSMFSRQPASRSNTLPNNSPSW